MRSLSVCCLLGALFLFASCSKDNDKTTVDDTQGLTRIQTLSNEFHLVDLYTANGKFQTGYNAIYFQVKTKDGSPVNELSASWTPIMHMTSMSHSCPASTISKKENTQGLYQGYVIFQMAENQEEYWELKIDYTVNGTSYSAFSRIPVTAAPRATVQSFQGSDDKRYVLALVEPVSPKVGLNDMTAALYRMSSMTQFDRVDNYSIEIDPRMPGMGNHGSPNNVHLVQGTDKLYHGKLSLTMTGYWKINLRLLDAGSTPIKGEAIEGETTASSLYFETEF
ncbi:MAG: hypothetical protein P0Y53_00535 [Candidatus Pseudobacter hemicellulosilyticus]|uniref:YtkA-like domain-containing protein n=1 Tax=Candidatus Pseudobacter hemicellulosilyticus TaxID=3121375 RepID=A0AAJ5WS24_9BACT|nr:MAG: hypothetical protein P0Y53_00535 [Pseudobacter sp.]